MIARISIDGNRIEKSFKTAEQGESWLSEMRLKHSDKSLPNEVWEKVLGFNRYELSNLGRIRSLNYKKTGMVKVLKPALSKDGYLKTMIQRDNGTYITRPIHRLVAIAFYGIHKGKEVNHIDGVKINNHAINLEWITHAENCQHSFDIGLQKPKRGDLNGNSKLTQEQVKRARKLKETKGRFWGRNELAKEFGISAKHLQKVVNDKTSWADT